MLSPDQCVERVQSLHRSIVKANPAWEVGLFHRLSHAIRLHAGTEEQAGELLVGREEGVAMQARSRTDGTTAFAACSGMDPIYLGRDLGRAGREGGGPVAGEGQLWPLHGVGMNVDRDDWSALPSPADLEDWLRRARNELSQPRLRDRRLRPPAECRVEVAGVTETWVADGGMVRSRTRRRVWAMAHPAAEADLPTQRPLVIAARNWQGLPADGWRTVLDDRSIGRGTGKQSGALNGPLPVLFNPECSAELGLALVKAYHDPALGSAAQPAAGWTIIDDPTDPDALFGGKFDDAGFPTAATTLWRDGRVVGRLDGAGHLRRPSYRDRPGPMPTHLTIRVPGERPPKRFLLVTRVTLHPLGPVRWVLEVNGAVLDEGRPAVRVRGGFISTGPEDLAMRCIASVGPARHSYLGVRTPALLFDDLSVRA